MQRILGNCLAHKKHIINGDYWCLSLPLQTWEHVGPIMLHHGHMACPRQKKDASCFHPKPLPIFLVSFPSIGKNDNNTANMTGGMILHEEIGGGNSAKTIQLISSKIKSHSCPGSRAQALIDRTVNGCESLRSCSIQFRLFSRSCVRSDNNKRHELALSLSHTQSSQWNRDPRTPEQLTESAQPNSLSAGPRSRWQRGRGGPGKRRSCADTLGPGRSPDCTAHNKE